VSRRKPFEYEDDRDRERLEYLDDLRKSGVCNMFLAGAPLARKFSLSPARAAQVLARWMKTFGARGCPGLREPKRIDESVPGGRGAGLPPRNRTEAHRAR